MDARAPRDGKAIEELGTYDPMVKDADARAILKADRIDYWLGVGALPTEKVKALIKKYGSQGTHVEQQKAALERLRTIRPQAPPPMVVPRPKKAAPAEEDVAEDSSGGTPADEPANESGGGESGDE
jgi:small subunit ribosomal protein S16